MPHRYKSVPAPGDGVRLRRWGLVGFFRRQIVRFHFRRRWFACALIGVAGCATIPPDRGYADVREQIRQRGVALPADAGADRSALIDEILAQPITADAAVRVALVNNPRIQVEFAKLGVTGAEVIQAGRLSNPTLAMTWQTSSRSSDASRYDVGLTQN